MYLGSYHIVFHMIRLIQVVYSTYIMGDKYPRINMYFIQRLHENMTGITM